jgi:hypothetical protein
MTKLLDKTLETIHALPPDAQDDIARIILQLAGADDEAPVTLSRDEEVAIAASKEAAAQGEFASEAQVQAIWTKHGL